MSLSLLRSSLTVVALLASATALSAQNQLAPLI